MDNTFGMGSLDAYAAMAAATCAQSTSTPTFTPTPTRTNTPTPTRTSTPTPSNTPTPTNTPTRSNTPTITATPTLTFTPTATPSIDTDGDGVLDHVDNCPLVANPDQLNTDAKPVDNEPDVAGDDASVPNSDKLGESATPNGNDGC